MRIVLSLVVVFLSSASAYAIEEICVRDFGEDICSRGTGFARVETIDREVICVRSLKDSLCKSGGGEDIYHVYAEDGELVCTIDYDSPQTPYCASQPDTYKWVPLAFPDESKF